jgi:hypothetical protein
MLRGITVFLITALIASAATIRLYLKDGDYQLVREYQVLQDRVRYYSTERGAWEEIPLELVDLNKTVAEIKKRDAEMKEEATALAVEEKAEREREAEVARIPIETGVYLIDGKDLKTIQPAETKVVGNKRRSILKVMSPIPIVSGKGTLEIDGERSANVVKTATPEFYIRLSAGDRFRILRLGVHKGNRVVEKFDIIPVTNEIVEDQDEVEIFRQQVGDALYKIWPVKALEPGEYAVIEGTPAANGSINLQVWDFSYAPAKPAK